jgi:hypothetical protein
VSDSDQRVVFETGGMKNNRDKARVDLLPGRPLLEISKVLGRGAEKYAANNWRLGLKYSDTMGSLMRHLIAFNEGEDDDPETGLSHLAHAGCQLLFLLEYELRGTGIDDRWKEKS